MRIILLSVLFTVWDYLDYMPDDAWPVYLLLLFHCALIDYMTASKKS